MHLILQILIAPRSEDSQGVELTLLTLSEIKGWGEREGDGGEDCERVNSRVNIWNVN